MEGNVGKREGMVGKRERGGREKDEMGTASSSPVTNTTRKTIWYTRCRGVGLWTSDGLPCRPRIYPPCPEVHEAEAELGRWRDVM